MLFIKHKSESQKGNKWGCNCLKLQLITFHLLISKALGCSSVIAETNNTKKVTLKVSPILEIQLLEIEICCF